MSNPKTESAPLDITVNPAFMASLLHDFSGKASERELVTAAMELFNWTVQEIRRGRVVLSCGQKDEAKARLFMPILERVIVQES